MKRGKKGKKGEFYRRTRDRKWPLEHNFYHSSRLMVNRLAERNSQRQGTQRYFKDDVFSREMHSLEAHKTI